jgi:magnesium transporter
MYKIDLELNDSALKQELLKLHPADIATIFDNLENDDQTRIESLLDKNTLIKVIPELSNDSRKKLFKNLPDKDKRSILKALESDDNVDLLKLYSKEEQKLYLSLLSKKEEQSLTKLLDYDITHAGSLMTIEFVTIENTLSIKDATQKVIQTIDDRFYIDTIFVTDVDNKLIGTIDIKDLIIARYNNELDSIINKKYIYTLENARIGNVVEKIQAYDIKVIPVLNRENQILGIITADDIFNRITLEHQSEYQKMVAVNNHDDELSPLKRSAQRLPWLLISVLLNLVIAGFLSVFQNTLEQVVTLVLFQPMILGMAGNIGTQSLAVTILGLHNKTLQQKHHILREMTIGLINSIITGIIGFIVVLVFLFIFPAANDSIIKISLVVGISLCCSMFISAMSGVIIPIVLSTFGFDESAASGPMISTINDFSALGIYFGVATILLINI